MRTVPLAFSRKDASPLKNVLKVEAFARHRSDNRLVNVIGFCDAVVFQVNQHREITEVVGRIVPLRQDAGRAAFRGPSPIRGARY
jgi:hypothetical protein